jgi:hypothetical protein
MEVVNRMINPPRSMLIWIYIEAQLTTRSSSVRYYTFWYSVDNIYHLIYSIRTWARCFVSIVCILSLNFRFVAWGVVMPEKALKESGSISSFSSERL